MTVLEQEAFESIIQMSRTMEKVARELERLNDNLEKDGEKFIEEDERDDR